MLTLMPALGALAAATLLVVNGNIHTLDPARPRAEALVARDGAIVFVGPEAEARAVAGAPAGAAAPAGVKVLDLGGRTAVPGFADAHAHLGGLGALERGALDLREAKSFDEVVAAVRDEAKRRKPGEWILGSRWDHESWPGRELPAHGRISEAAPENPVWLDRVDGHMGLANAAAMKLAGVTAETPAPAGGAILRDAKGAPSGLFVDNAIDLVTRAIASGQRGTYADLVLAAQARCFAVGLTTVHDAGIEPSEIATLKRLADDGKLKLNVYAMVAATGAGLRYVATEKPIVGYGKTRALTVRALKIIADGAMGSRGAWLLAPYADRPADDDGKPYLGLPVYDPKALRRDVATAIDRGFQVATHAIGDRANREVLDAYEQAGRDRSDGLAKDFGLGALRLRIEHAQLVAPADIPRFGRLGVIASMQPTHATSDMRWAERRVGPERLRGAYAWASLLKAGARICFGSDFPVEAPDPLAGFHAAVTRQDAQGSPPGGWLPGERVTREEALRGFTEWPAYAAFEEQAKGRLAPGFRADVVVLTHDILTCTTSELLLTKVHLTILGGEVVFPVQ